MGEPTLVIATPEIRLHASGDLERLSSTGEHWIPIGWEPQLANAVAATLAARDERVRELGEELHERETVCDMWRSSVSEGIEERDRLRAHIATLERELAEARQREEDSTDLILRQGRELAELRPKVEAAERRAEVPELRQWRRWAAGAEVLRVAVTDGNNPSSKEDGHSSLPSSKEDAP